MIKKSFLLIIVLLVFLTFIGLKNPLSIIEGTTSGGAMIIPVMLDIGTMKMAWDYDDLADAQDFGCFTGLQKNIEQVLINQRDQIAGEWKSRFLDHFREGRCYSDGSCYDIYTGIDNYDFFNEVGIDRSRSNVLVNGQPAIDYVLVIGNQADGIENAFCIVHNKIDKPSYSIDLQFDFSAPLLQKVDQFSPPVTVTNFEEIKEDIIANAPEIIPVNNLQIISGGKTLTDAEAKQQIGFFQWLLLKIKAFLGA